MPTPDFKEFIESLNEALIILSATLARQTERPLMHGGCLTHLRRVATMEFSRAFQRLVITQTFARN